MSYNSQVLKASSFEIDDTCMLATSLLSKPGIWEELQHQIGLASVQQNLRVHAYCRCLFPMDGA